MYLKMLIISIIFLHQTLVDCHKTNVSFTLDNLGEITGVESRTKFYPNAPEEFRERTTYVFRGIPYAYPVMNETRFQQSKILNDTALREDGSFDATQDGPLCQQGDIDPFQIHGLTDATIGDFMTTLEIPGLLHDILTGILEQVFDLDDGFLDKDRTVGEVLHEWLDIRIDVSEDCLHLAVHTPIKPDGTEKKNLPVMFFIHGGAFAFGTQIRMGGERLQAW